MDYDVVKLTEPRRISIRQWQIPHRDTSKSQNCPGNHTWQQRYDG